MGARDLLADLAGAGLAVTAEGGRLVIRPASKLTDSMRAALHEAKLELLVLLRRTARESDPLDSAEDWTDVDISAFLERRARLLSWGWSELNAEILAERLMKRDRGVDDRVSCTECRHCRGGRCANYLRAGVGAPELGRDMMEILQRCPGFDSTDTSR